MKKPRNLKESFDYLIVGLAVILFLWCPHLRATALEGTRFKIEGYKKQIASPKSKITVTAKYAHGLTDLGFEELNEATVVAESETQILKMHSPHILFKNDEIVLSGDDSTLEYETPAKKLIFKLVARRPERSIYVSLANALIKAPSFYLKLGKTSFSSGGLLLDLNNRTITIVGGSKAKDKPFTKSF